MSSSLMWQRLRVEDFLSQGNWYGIAAPPPVPVTLPLVVQASPDQWLGYTLEQFCLASNWRGDATVQPAPERPTSVLAGPAKSAGQLLDLQQTVYQFFHDLNWYGQPLTLPTPVELIKPRLRLDLTVAEFWQQCPWQGGPSLTEAIAAVPTLEPPIDEGLASQEDRDLTLDHLSDLF